MGNNLMGTAYRQDYGRGFGDRVSASVGALNQNLERTGAAVNERTSITVGSLTQVGRKVVEALNFLEKRGEGDIPKEIMPFINALNGVSKIAAFGVKAVSLPFFLVAIYAGVRHEEFKKLVDA